MPLKKADNNNNNNNNAATTKPLMPTLASNRNLKSPITPRLAAASATPPLAKRAAPTSAPIKSPPPREELSTPAKAFIANNVTPRSSSRKSRVDSNHTTPTGTPNGSRPSSHTDLGSGGRQPPFGSLGLGIVTSGNKSRPSSTIGGPTSPGIHSHLRLSRPDDTAEGSMFFHASEVQRSPELRPSLKKSPVFMYANGQQDESVRLSGQPSPPLSSVSSRSKKSQFFRADGRADSDVPPVPSLPSPPATNTLPQFFQPALGARPPSPAKDANFHLSYRKGVSQIMRPGDRPKTISILPPTTTDARKRSTSGLTTSSASHKRTSSLSSIESGSSARKLSHPGLDGTGLTPLQTAMQAQSPVLRESSGSSLPGMSTDGVNRKSLHEDTGTLPGRERQTSPSSPILSVPQSPTKGPGGWQPQLAETIMNARVERKIQDLEISNSSLMAINKSLEKEVRRQKKELRQFRRLSRAGRLSMLSGTGSIGTVGDHGNRAGLWPSPLGALDELFEEDGLEDGLEDDIEEEEEDSSDSSSNSDLASLSASAIAEREERKLARDSRRLQLDLAKHREILVDSQKMNQSLKRCRAWTEMMIKDGRKALAYEADIGNGAGRVLDHDDLAENDDVGDGAENDDEPRQHSLLSSWSPSPMPVLERLDGILGLDTSEITRQTWSRHSNGEIEQTSDANDPIRSAYSEVEAAVEAMAAFKPL